MGCTFCPPVYLLPHYDSLFHDACLAQSVFVLLWSTGCNCVAAIASAGYVPDGGRSLHVWTLAPAAFHLMYLHCRWM